VEYPVHPLKLMLVAMHLLNNFLALNIKIQIREPSGRPFWSFPVAKVMWIFDRVRYSISYLFVNISRRGNDTV